MVVFYTSSHGLGHVTRDIEVIHALRGRLPNVTVVMRTSVPEAFVTAASRAPIAVQRAVTDTGMAQIDSLEIDEAETARRAAGFYEEFADRVATEAAVLRRLGARVVVGDVPPLAFAAAARAGVPSVALANFTWDWIYAAAPGFESRAPGVLATIRDAYATATRALRLPMHGGFEPMAGVVRDIPLVARRSARDRNEIRRSVGLAYAQLVVLASFGGHGLDLPFGDIARQRRFTLVLTEGENSNAAERLHDSHLRHFSAAQLTTLGVRYEDLVASADVVVSKPGYGIVSECIANGTALLYTSRSRFVEQDVLVREMPRVLRCRHITPDALRAGEWADAVDTLVAQPPPPDRLAIDGADVAAAEIAAIAEG